MNLQAALPFGVTHEVLNQPPPLGSLDLYATDAALRDALRREGGAWAEPQVAAYGRIAGGELMELGFAANANKPQLRLFDPYGHRLDEVSFHPSYHRVMELAMRHGVHSFAWVHEDKPGAHVARAALCYLHHQAEQGTSCPITMTYACVPSLRAQPDVAREWLPRVTALDYDPRALPAAGKRACMIGMGMTEKQGGSDVRANTTRAHAAGGGAYELVGHKWFLSAPMCDAFLVLAQADGGLTCFLLPRWRPDGTRNALRIQRLKDKLGNWSNASSEVEFQGAHAVMIGEGGRGVATILDMVALTRLDCMVCSAALARQALVQAIHHASHRKAFGKRLIEHPLMRNVLADLALETEAATALAFRAARAVDEAPRDAQAAALARIGTAVGKYWVCKRAPAAVNEAQECLGGAGYVEETMLPRLYREAPLNSLWEGCGNIQCLDVLRAMAREPETVDAYFAELRAAKGAHPALDRETAALQRALADRDSLELRSRHVVERMALAWQASILLRAGNGAVAEAFCASRLAGEHGMAFG
ncbi:MAG: isovaleryl-CoA dehydrogenase, partial [Gammaproteobacteria bacterium]|nr:isovaleryl-CoA dehydrogenase [Gammaproteobacteria bacterium]